MVHGKSEVGGKRHGGGVNDDQCEVGPIKTSATKAKNVDDDTNNNNDADTANGNYNAGNGSNNFNNADNNNDANDDNNNKIWIATQVKTCPKWNNLKLFKQFK